MLGMVVLNKTAGSSPALSSKNGSDALMVGQRAVNPQVTGSTPVQIAYVLRGNIGIKMEAI